MSVCSDCGHELPKDTGAYCPNCGARRNVARAVEEADDRELIAELQSRGIRVEPLPHSSRLFAAVDMLRDIDPRVFRRIEQLPPGEEIDQDDLLACIDTTRQVREAVKRMDEALRGLTLPGILPDKEG